MIESTRSDSLRPMEPGYGKRIRLVRKLANLRQEGFAAAILATLKRKDPMATLTRGAVGNWELESVGIEDDNLAAIVETFGGVSLEWLMMNRGDPPTSVIWEGKTSAKQTPTLDALSEDWPELERSARHIMRARKRIASLPDDQARALVLALLSDARRPINPLMSSPAAEQLDIRAETIIRPYDEK